MTTQQLNKFFFILYEQDFVYLLVLSFLMNLLKKRYKYMSNAL